MTLLVKIKKLVPEAVIPAYMKPGDAGMDLVATSKVFDEAGNCTYGTGIAIEVPEGYVGLIFPRSSNAKKDLLLSNSVGVIDSGYRGEIMLKFKPAGYFACNPTDLSEGDVSESFEFICFGKEHEDDTDNTAVYAIGDRIGQIIIMPYPNIAWEEVFDLSTTERGTGGYGSTNSTAALPGDPGFQGSHLL